MTNIILSLLCLKRQKLEEERLSNHVEVTNDIINNTFRNGYQTSLNH